jgi:hypothetical protein
VTWFSSAHGKSDAAGIDIRGSWKTLRLEVHFLLMLPADILQHRK